MLRFVLLVNKQGQTRLAQYYDDLPATERRVLESEMVRRCLARPDGSCSFVEHRGYKVRPRAAQGLRIPREHARLRCAFESAR